MFPERQVGVFVQVLGQPRSERSALQWGPPGDGFGSTSPVSRRRFNQRLMVGKDTEKVFATSSLGVSLSTAASTLILRSFEYGFMAGGYHMDQPLCTPL